MIPELAAPRFRPLALREAGGDLLGEVDLAVAQRLVADLRAGVGDAPEPVCVAADAVDDQEGHAVLVGDVLRLHHADGLLYLVALREIGAEAAVHRLEIAGLREVGVVTRAADAP